MPVYDYRCASGHTAERREGVDVGRIDCPTCGAEAQRVPCYPGRVPELTGYRPRPTKEAPIHISRFQEAHGEMLHTAEKHGIEPPDLYRAAKERVKRGDAVAIE